MDCLSPSPTLLAEATLPLSLFLLLFSIPLAVRISAGRLVQWVLGLCSGKFDFSFLVSLRRQTFPTTDVNSRFLLALICVISLLLTISFTLFASKDFRNYNTLERAYSLQHLGYLER